MLMMRRHEKDFMLRGTAKYGDDLKARAAEFRTKLAASDIPAAAQADLVAKLEAYQRDFFAWMDTALVIAAEQKAISESFARIEPIVDEVETRGRPVRRHRTEGRTGRARRHQTADGNRDRRDHRGGRLARPADRPLGFAVR